jgi:NAD(P)-dependent dehydrogenase (short-subunit alcohol dehydrogenase family)
MVVNMSADDWDSVIRVHLRGTFAPTNAALAYWRGRSKAGEDTNARVINTSSPSGIFGNVGQANYGAAKAGIAAFTVITAMEVARYGVAVNAIAPAALTRMTAGVSGGQDVGGGAHAGWDPMAPDNIAPLVVWLGSDESRGITGRVFTMFGGHLGVAEGWVEGPTAERDRRWDVKELSGVVPDLVARAAPNARLDGRRD